VPEPGADLTTGADGVVVVGGNTPPASLTDDQIKAIREKTAAIRNSYIN